MKTMKKLLIAAIALMGTMTLNAQPRQEKAENAADREAKRQELALKQAQGIAQELAFDLETTSRFTTTYLACQKEIWALGPARRNDGVMNEAEAEEIIKGQFERNEKIQQIREKYYGEYSKFLTQKQILRVYEIEKRMHGKMAEHHGKKGGPGRGAGRGPERGPERGPRPGGQQ